MTGHVGGVEAVAFAPDGRKLATAGTDGTARLWDLRETGRPAAWAVLAGHADRVHSVAFSRDGRSVLTAGEDRTARLWPTTTERAAAEVGALSPPRISRPQWARYLPGVPYEPPCA